jgi:hypothetical protein
VVPSPTATAAAGDGTAAEVVAGKVVSELVLDMHSFPAHMLTSTPLWFRYLMPGFSLGGRRGGWGIVPILRKAKIEGRKIRGRRD